MQLNLATITVHFNYVKLCGHSDASRRHEPCYSSELVLSGTISSAKQLLKNDEKKIRISRTLVYKLADEMRVNPDTCRRENSI